MRGNFKIDEVVTVSGQLVSVDGSIGVKTPVGGKVARVKFKDGQSVEKNDLLVQFDTRQAESNRDTLNLITLEEADLADKIEILDQQRKVLEKKYKQVRSYFLRSKVGNGRWVPRIQYLQQQDQLFELKHSLRG